MVPQLNDDKRLFGHGVDHAVFSINSARPKALKVVLQRFGFTFTVEGSALHILDKVMNALTHLLVRAEPVQIIFPRLLAKAKKHVRASKVCSPLALLWLALNPQR